MPNGVVEVDLCSGEIWVGDWEADLGTALDVAQKTIEYFAALEQYQEGQYAN